MISATLSGESPAQLRLSFRTKPKARAALEEELFGKWGLCDKDDGLASTAVIISDYRSRKPRRPTSAR